MCTTENADKANVKDAHMKKIVRLYHPAAKYLHVLDTYDSQSSGEEKYFINILVLFCKLACFTILHYMFFVFSINKGKQRIY